MFISWEYFIALKSPEKYNRRIINTDNVKNDGNHLPGSYLFDFFFYSHLHITTKSTLVFILKYLTVTVLHESVVC